MKDVLSTVQLVDAQIAQDATLLEAAGVLVEKRVSALAMLDDDGKIIGVFGERTLIEGLFPSYLGELHHTAFAVDDTQILDRCAQQAATEPAREHLVEAEEITLDEDTSATHVAELFLHHGLAALPVIRDGTFVGMLRRTDFARAMLNRQRDP